MARQIFLAPHNDDETLFGAYTIIRSSPLVVIATDSFIQWNRGDGITYEERQEESRRAMEILGAEIKFLGIRDDELTEKNLRESLKQFDEQSIVYCPAIQGGNAQHDLVGRVASELFQTIKYTTYTKTELWTKGEIEIIPTEEEKELKNKALDCYVSQLRINLPHFEAVRNKSEWLQNSL